jgi:hypothetical protein
MAKRKYRNYTDNDVREACAKVYSMAELLRTLNLKIVGGNYSHMRKTLQRLQLNCEHWTGKAWNKNQQLKDWSEYSKVNSLKPHLIRDRGHKCEKCSLSEWNGQPIPLEVEHANGDRTNHSKDNVLLLCCNCHAQTSTWRGRKNKK